MNYIIILKALLNKNKYKEYIKYINIRKDNLELSFLFNILNSLYEKHKDAEEFTVDEFSAYASSHCSEKLSESVNMLLERLRTAEASDAVLADLLLEEKQRSQAYEIALMAMDVNEGRKPFDSLVEQFSQLPKVEVASEEIIVVTDDLEELYEHNVTNVGLRWRLKTLNEMLGSLRRGDFGFIFARPESGKTTFLASENSYFAEQLESLHRAGGKLPGETILHFNNEEQGEKVQIRYYQAALGCDLPTLFSDRQGNKQRYKEITGNRIKIIDNSSIYKRDVERIVESMNPALIVFDQIDKIKGFNSDREDLRLGSIYQWARELAKSYAPVVGVTQADGSGEGKRWLTMENVANAKTSKQAEADFILGIGKLNEQGYEYVRHLHLSKNKLSGDPDTIPELRHGRRDVIIRPEVARYQDIE